jgi:type II secretory pathway component PulF
MKTYLYKAKNGPDKIIEGRINAFSSDEAVSKLYQKGYVATSIKEISESDDNVGKAHSFFSRVSSGELTNFTSQSARLLKAGVPMLQALNIMSEQIKNPYFKSAIHNITERIKSGSTFSQALEAYPKIFPYFYAAMVKSGEGSGALNESLSRIAHYYMKQRHITRKIKSALAYPVFILITGIATVVFVFTNVLPKIMPVILSLKMTLPLPTRILLATSDMIQVYWFWIVLLILVIYLLVKKTVAKNSLTLHLSEFKKRIPVFGNILYKAELSRFLRSLETSTRGGINIIDSLKLSVSTLNEVYIRERISGYLGGLQQGERLSDVLEKTGFFPAFSIAAVRIGEESGNLPDSLSEVSDMFESECEEHIGIMVSLIEPMMILVIGLIVGFIISAVLLPVFQVTDIQF